MQGFFSLLFEFERYMPHGYCFLWMPHILWLHIIGDIVVALAYYSIPVTILYLTYKRKKNLPFRWVFLMFSIFIFLCGTTHLVELITLWYPIYYFEGVLKVITAIVSLVTAILLFPLIPRLLHIFENFPSLSEKSKK